MLPILTANQTKEADAFTIKNEPISSLDLMERASGAFVKKFIELEPSAEVLVLAGVGNNGGDGLAIARILLEKGYNVAVYSVGDENKQTPDRRENLVRLSKEIKHHWIGSRSDFPALEEYTVVVDAIFGSGLSRFVGGLFGELIDSINASDLKVYAVDIPSGLFADKIVTDEGAIIRANATISFQLPKFTFLQPGYSEFVGRWFVVPIGLHPDFLANAKTEHYFLEQADIKQFYKPKPLFSHKGSNGRVLLMAGAKGKMGAAVLAAKAAMRAGAGLLTVHAPAAGRDVLQVAVPEAMVSEDEYLSEIASFPEQILADVVAMGPGIGTSGGTLNALKSLLQNVKAPIVLDADALNLLSENKELLDQLPEDSILTPHPGEFRRLVGDWENDFQKLELLQGFCRKHQVNVVLKGAYSAIADKSGKIYFNATGNPGMATGGSGDVLTGIVAAILAQGYLPHQALMMAVYLHGKAGDLAAVDKGFEGLIASDIIDYLPLAFRSIYPS